MVFYFKIISNRKMKLVYFLKSNELWGCWKYFEHAWRLLVKRNPIPWLQQVQRKSCGDFTGLQKVGVNALSDWVRQPNQQTLIWEPSQNCVFLQQNKHRGAVRDLACIASTSRSPGTPQKDCVISASILRKGAQGNYLLKHLFRTCSTLSINSL